MNPGHSQHLPEPAVATLAPEPLPAHSHYQADVFTTLRLLFYLLVVAKVVSLAFFRRRTVSAKERIYRKFLFAHSEMLKHFTEDDRANMETTLSNTLRNSKIDYHPRDSRLRRPTKTVHFETQRNKYYEPRKCHQQQQGEEFMDIPAPALHPHETFQERKVEDEFAEREDLIELSDKSQEAAEEGQSKLTQPTQPSALSEPVESFPEETAGEDSADGPVEGEEARLVE